MFTGDPFSYLARALAVSMVQPSVANADAAAAETSHWALDEILWDPDEMVRPAPLGGAVHALFLGRLGGVPAPR